MNWNCKDTLWLIALVASSVASNWTAAVMVKTRNMNLENEVRQAYVDAFLVDLYRPLEKRVAEIESDSPTPEIIQLQNIAANHERRIQKVSQQFSTDRDLRYEVLVELTALATSEEEREQNQRLTDKLFPEKSTVSQSPESR